MKERPETTVTWLRGQRVLRVLCGLLAPADRREEFWADLLDEAEMFRLPRQGAGRASFWMWTQVIASAPHLLAMRWGRLRANDRVLGALTVEPPLSREEARVGLALFVRQGGASALRRVPLVLSVALHAALIGLGVVASFWRVDVLNPPTVIVTRLPPPPPPMERIEHKRDQKQVVDESGGSRDPKRGRPPTKRVEPRPSPVIDRSHTNSLVPPSDGPETDDPPGVPAGRDDGKDLGPSGPGPGTGHSLPPQVGTRQCLSCTPPRLPPAYVRAGLTQRAMVRTCVDTEGRVTSVKVLRGISPDVDAGVTATVQGWRFAPLRLDGRAVPFCYNTLFEFSSL